MFDSLCFLVCQGLPTNQFGQSIQAIGHRLEQHATAIVAGVCVFLVVGAAGIWWSRQSSAKTTAAWTLLESSNTVDHYANIADTYEGTLPGRWARLREAETYLEAGMSRMFSDREFALGQLKKARELFEQLADDKAVGPTILERALWGLAVTAEATNSGDTGKVIDAYQRLLDAIPDTFYKPIAEQRIAALKTGGAKEFYAWFSKQMPKPDESRPNDGATDDLESLLPSPGKSEFNHDSIMKPAGGKKDDPAKSDPAKDEPKPQDPPADPAKPEADATKPESTPAPKSESEPDPAPAKPEAKPEEKSDAKPEAKPDEQETDKKE